MKDTRDIIGLNVFSIEEGRILGRTAECVVDLAGGKVLGLIVQVAGGGEVGVVRADVKAVGKDAVMVASDEVLKPLAEAPILSDHRTVGKAPRVLTRSGEVLGTLGLVRVDEACRKVESYQIEGDLVQAIADGPATLGIMKGTVHGRDAIVLPDDAAKEMKRPGGLRASLGKAFGTVREKATEVSGKLGTAAKKARAASEKAGEKALGTVREKAHEYSDKLGDAAKKARAASEKMGEQALAAAKDVRETVEKKVEALHGKPVARKAPKKAVKKAPAKRKTAKKAPVRQSS